MQANETDSSGHCSVSYTSTGPLSFHKSKFACISEDLPYQIHPDQLFSVNVESNREATYEMSSNNDFIKSIRAEESHILKVTIKPDAGNKVKITQELTHKETKKVTPIVNDKIDNVIEQVSNQFGSQFTQETLFTEREAKLCKDSACPSFAKLVGDYSDNLKNYGTLKAANGYLKTLSAARDANRDDIIKVLKKKQNKPAL